jgi:hypothetical protein
MFAFEDQAWFLFSHRDLQQYPAIVGLIVAEYPADKRRLRLM